MGKVTSYDGEGAGSPERDPTTDLCKSSSFNATSCRGDLARPCVISDKEDGARPTTAPISARVIPFPRRSAMSDFQSVMPTILRKIVVDGQRQSVVPFRKTRNMGTRRLPRPAELLGETPKAQGARVKYWRMQIPGLTQKRLGKLVGLSETAISSIETGIQEDSSKLYQIAAALKVGYQYLKDGKGDPKESVTPVQLVSDAAPPPFSPDILKSVEAMDSIEREVLENRMRREIEQILSVRHRRNQQA
jgi:transcriptional regulator with XRE-family HTH domain